MRGMRVASKRVLTVQRDAPYCPPGPSEDVQLARSSKIISKIMQEIVTDMKHSTSALLERAPLMHQKEPVSSPAHRTRAIPYPALQHHGLIGDRRTAACISSDGTLDWLCLPDYNGDILFGALLDWAKGGLWRMGPAQMVEGEQSYEEDTMVLETQWDLETGSLVLRDTMLWPEANRAPEQNSCRVLVRALSCTRGRVRCEFDLRPAFNFTLPQIEFSDYSTGISIQVNEWTLRLWSNLPPQPDGPALLREVELKEGEELWAVLEYGAAGHGWSVESAGGALNQAREYWRNWLGSIHHTGLGAKEMRRTAMIIHMLSYAPDGSVVAAPTTSLPERIGGGWNADYRFSWVRDASLTMGMLARLGHWQETERYLQWLAERRSRFGQPLQVLYGIHGEKRHKQRQLSAVAGYRNSAPVRIGNHAYKQFQIGSFGFLADCVWLYLEHGGDWREDYWTLVCRVAEYALKHWQEPDNGIWELSEKQHFVSSKVLSWVTLERAVRIAQKVNASFDVTAWQQELPIIHRDVIDNGWSQRLGAFRQRYEAENLDSATLLVSVLEFLPGDHPRVLSTLDAVSEGLTINGLAYRFDPAKTFGELDLPLGQMEGAFLPCAFWLATAYAKASQPEKAKAILRQVEGVAGKLGLLAEGLDPRTRHFLGNTPLLFSHVEYIRAKMELAKSLGGDPVTS